MFNLNEKIRVKSIAKMLAEGLIKPHAEKNNVYSNGVFTIYKNFPCDNQTGVIAYIDNNDSEIPYFCDININDSTNGYWLPEYAIESLTNPVVKPVEPKVWMNQHTKKQFGPLFVKLIELDERIATISNTQFGKLRVHELNYIANVLMKHFNETPKFDSSDDIRKYCYAKAQKL